MSRHDKHDCHSGGDSNARTSRSEQHGVPSTAAPANLVGSVPHRKDSTTQLSIRIISSDELIRFAGCVVPGA
jgi:hypothetical protein